MKMMEEEPKSLFHLPYEILVHIFSFLSVLERRSVRLTSSQCYDVSIAPSIRKREKFVLRTQEDVTEFADFLDKSQNRNMCVEFESIQDHTPISGPWQSSGENLHSLCFLDTRLSDSLMREIIRNCVNLVELLIGSSYNDPPTFDCHAVLFSMKAFDDAAREKVQRTKLRVFSLVINYAHIPSWLLRNIFHVYPQIEKLGIGSTSYSWLMRRSSFSRPSTFSKHFLKLESLIFNVMSSGNWIKTWIDQHNAQPKLKRFEAILLCTDSLFPWLFRFFSVQTELQVVILTLLDYDKMTNGGGPGGLSKLLAHIEAKCTDLRECNLLA